MRCVGSRMTDTVWQILLVAVGPIDWVQRVYIFVDLGVDMPHGSLD